MVWVLVCIQLQAVVVVLTSRPEWNGWPPDQPWPTLWPDDTAFAVGSWLQDVGGAVLAGGAAALMVVRLTRLTDIPCRSVSSGGGDLMVPGRVFVVVRAGFEAAVQDADEPVRELP